MDQMKNSGADAFSLIELLVVMAVLAILVSVSVPALTSLTAGSNLNRAGQLVGDQIAMARQEAVAKNRDVQIVFYNLTNGLTKGWRGMSVQRIEQTSSGKVMVAVSKVAQLPDNVIISESSTLSPMLTAGTTGTTNLANFGSVQYSAFRFRANGSLEGGFGAANNILTLQMATAQGNPPSNYYTIQVNALTGRVSVYRP
jgi:uncharacterized protein (TIGR02596 family)